MYPLIRIDKRIPDGSIWQTRWGYLLPPLAGWTRVFQPTGTRWSNPLGGWTAKTDGVSLFHPDRPFVIACHGPDDDRRFYIDVAHRVRIEVQFLEFVDLFLDVMIDAVGAVTEKDEDQLVYLPREFRDFALVARNEVRGLIAAGDPLFNSRSAFYSVPSAARALPPSKLVAEIS